MNVLLRAMVQDKLELKWSPQQIAGWLSRIDPDDEAMRISHETIYLSGLTPRLSSRVRRLAQAGSARMSWIISVLT